MSIANVTSFTGVLRAHFDMQKAEAESNASAPVSSSQSLAQALDNLDLSDAGHGTLLLKDRINDEGYAYSLVTFQEEALATLYTLVENVKSAAGELATADPADTVYYAELVELLADREDQLSSYIGSQLHSGDIDYAAVYDPDIGEKTYLEIFNINNQAAESGSQTGEIAALEVDFFTVFESLHNPSSCPHCSALAQQAVSTESDGTTQTAYALDANDNGVDDVDSTSPGNATPYEALNIGAKWNLTSTAGGAGSDATLSYSFYDGDTSYPATYNASSGTPGTPSSVLSKGATNETTLTAAFDAWDATADFDFVEVEEDGTAVGEMRVAFTDRSSSAAAFAYRPGDYAVNGDVWFETEDIDITGNDFSTDGIGAGGFNYFAALHEIGHALGLSHPFDTSDDQSNGDQNLALAYDSMRYTVMTYSQLDRNYVLQLQSSGSSVSTSPSYRIYASTPMLYDIEMMEDYYGAEDTSDGNTTYSFTNGPETIQTITDSGGTDTIDASSQTRENIINLNAGAFSSIGIYSVADQVTDLAATYGVSTTWLNSVVAGLDASASASNSYYAAFSRTALYTRESNVAIAHNAVIENATGGSANDTITGNASNNVLNAGAGDDIIEGNGGDDTIDGGAGTGDVAVFNDVRANYTITDNGDGTYTIAHSGGAGADGTDTFQNVEYLEFTDQTIEWPSETVSTTPATSGASGSSGSGGSGGSGASSSSGSTLAGVSVATASDAKAALTTLDNVLQTLQTRLARLGALRNRLEVSIGNLSAISIQTELALGRITDADFSSEMTKLTKNMILNQAATHVLSVAQLSKTNLRQLLHR
jgi:flagellin-like hook-associated protein FlgL